MWTLSPIWLIEEKIILLVVLGIVLVVIGVVTAFLLISFDVCVLSVVWSSVWKMY